MRFQYFGTFYRQSADCCPSPSVKEAKVVVRKSRVRFFQGSTTFWGCDGSLGKAKMHLNVCRSYQELYPTRKLELATTKKLNAVDNSTYQEHFVGGMTCHLLALTHTATNNRK